MSDTVSFTELDGQHVELLAARTVLSLFSAGSEGVASDGGLGGAGDLVMGAAKALGVVSSSTPGSTGGAASGTGS